MEVPKTKPAKVSKAKPLVVEVESDDDTNRNSANVPSLESLEVREDTLDISFDRFVCRIQVMY
jgi:hypothetical protein